MNTVYKLLKIISILGALIFISSLLLKHNNFCNPLDTDLNCFKLLIFNITYFVIFVPFVLFIYFTKSNKIILNFSFISLILFYLIVPFVNIDGYGFPSIKRFTISIIFIILYSLISLGIIIYQSFKKN